MSLIMVVHTIHSKRQKAEVLMLLRQMLHNLLLEQVSMIILMVLISICLLLRL